MGDEAESGLLSRRRARAGARATSQSLQFRRSFLQFGSHHHGRPSPALEGEHCDHDGERCGEELHYGPPRTFRARAEMFFAYLIGILGIALLGFGPH